jgi:transcriptional regulator with XRE-family HTH domain
MPSTSFGAFLRALRLKQGRSLRGVAKQLQVSPQYLSAVECSKSAPPAPARLKALARILQVDLDVLLAHAGRIPPDVLRALKDPSLFATIRKETHAHRARTTRG